MTAAISLKCCLSWQSAVATHHDYLFIPNWQFWQTPLPESLTAALVTNPLAIGDTVTVSFTAGELVSAFDSQKLITITQSQFRRQQRHGMVEPHLGRFYPQGYAYQALGCLPTDTQPLRVIAQDHEHLTVDINHPLANYSLTLNLTGIPTFHGSTLPAASLSQLLTDHGPGLQAPYPTVASDFYTDYPFQRANPAPDTEFYTQPRLVQHLDTTAIEQVQAIYGQLLQPGMRVLDLMSSWVSHLPTNLNDIEVTGLGLNASELKANPCLKDFYVHDLNQLPILPFADNSFDAVISTVSVEYLTQPLTIWQELVRVTRSGGIIIMVFSTRWFPPKVISLWTELHPFERQGLVLDYFVQTNCFKQISTQSIRGLPRPINDPHSKQTKFSDPVFVVYGYLS